MLRSVLVHYHEIGLKGKNRSTFERRLMDNLRHACKGLPVQSVGKLSGYVLVRLSDEAAARDVADVCAQVPGVARVSIAFLCAQDEAEFCAAAVQAMGECEDFETFKVHGRRSNTSYELHTLDLNRIVGSALCEAFPTKVVKMHGPDVTVIVHAVEHEVLVYAASRPGVGGLPVGSAGKVVTLLSSGFDSPVSTWMVGRRGAVCVPVHFSGRPQTADTSEWLCQDIVRKLAPAGCVGRMYVVPFGDRQREISLAVPPSLRILMYRRVMFAVAERIARIEGAKALVTGESLGQVASQTLDNIAAVNEVVSMPVLRPLIGSDKQEIIARAHEIGTFDICCESAEDCCTLFMPRSPETHAKPDQIHEAWDMFDHDAMIEDLVKSAEWVDFDQCPAYKPPRTLRERHAELAPRFSE